MTKGHRIRPRAQSSDTQRREGIRWVEGDVLRAQVGQPSKQTDDMASQFNPVVELNAPCRLSQLQCIPYRFVRRGWYSLYAMLDKVHDTQVCAQRVVKSKGTAIYSAWHTGLCAKCGMHLQFETG